VTVTPAHPLVRAAALGLAAARLTRFVTTDWLGEWWIGQPAKAWAEKVDGPDSAIDLTATGHHRTKLVKGLDCPFCVGFWVGGALLIGEAALGATSKSPKLVRGTWALGIGALALNYIVGHVSSRID